MPATIQSRTFVFSPAVEKHKIYKIQITILPTVLYRSEIWSLALREDHRLSVFEKRVVKGCRILHNEEFHALYSLSSTTRTIKQRKMRLAWNMAQMRIKRNEEGDCYEDLDVGG
jgi:hypothetical protein